jgi:hypothetical protein
MTFFNFFVFCFSSSLTMLAIKMIYQVDALSWWTITIPVFVFVMVPVVGLTILTLLFLFLTLFSLTKIKL